MKYVTRSIRNYYICIDIVFIFKIGHLLDLHILIIYIVSIQRIAIKLNHYLR